MVLSHVCSFHIQMRSNPVGYARGLLLASGFFFFFF